MYTSCGIRSVSAAWADSLWRINRPGMGCEFEQRAANDRRLLWRRPILAFLTTYPRGAQGCNVLIAIAEGGQGL